MKNKPFKHQKKDRPYHIPRPEPEKKPYRVYPEHQPEQEPERAPSPQPEYPEWLKQGSPGDVYMDEIVVYYSLN